jgi:hypothetical protein
LICAAREGHVTAREGHVNIVELLLAREEIEINIQDKVIG